MSTYDKILQAANHHIQTVGFEGFSYANIANDIGIRKASIHYYFPSKMDLGVAYCQYKEHQLDELKILVLEKNTFKEQLIIYLSAFNICVKNKEMCGIYAMLTDYELCSEQLQLKIKHLIQVELNLLQEILSFGRNQGQLSHAEVDLSQLANMINSMIKGALMFSRVFNEHYYKNTTEALLVQLVAH